MILMSLEALKKGLWGERFMSFLPQESWVTYPNMKSMTLIMSFRVWDNSDRGTKVAIFYVGGIRTQPLQAKFCLL